MDNSWNNNDLPSREKKTFDWTYIAIGSVLVLLLVGACVRGMYWITQNEEKIENWAQDQAKEDWLEARRIVEKLQTDDGAIGIYQSNPKLIKKFPSDQVFLKAVGQWRTQLEPPPEILPSVGSKRFGHRIGLGGGMATISFKMENGSWLNIAWDGPSTNSTRQIIDIDIKVR